MFVPSTPYLAITAISLFLCVFDFVQMAVLSTGLRFVRLIRMFRLIRSGARLVRVRRTYSKHAEEPQLNPMPVGEAP